MYVFTENFGIMQLKQVQTWVFPGGPVVKTLLSSAGDAGSIPGQGAKSHMPCSQKAKTYNKYNIVTNSTKTFKMFHIKKKKTKNKTQHRHPVQKIQKISYYMQYTHLCKGVFLKLLLFIVHHCINDIRFNYCNFVSNNASSAAYFSSSKLS